SSVPSTIIWPSWCSSRRLMQRIIVDFPDPDGPQMTMRSPCATSRFRSFRTWNWPYHLLTFDRRMMGSDMGKDSCDGRLSRRCKKLTVLALIQSAFQRLAVTRDRVAKDEVDDRNEQIRFRTEATPGSVGHSRFGRLRQVEDTDDDDQRRVFEQGDKNPHQRRNHNFQSLRQNDLAHLCPVVQADGVGALVLTLGNGLQTSTHGFCHIGRCEQNDGNLG